MSTRIRLTIAAIVSGVALSSCASLNVDVIPLPGNSYRDGYDLILEFANVLNLPDHAKVMLNGTKVGVVRKVTLTARGVDVTARLDHGVAVPSTIHAVLQQATVLGDTYVALEQGSDTHSTAAQLRPGSRIPTAQTTSPPQLEDTLANLANFIGSGSIQRAQNTVIGINRVTPPRAEVRAIASRAATDLADLADNIDEVDLLLKGLSESAEVAAAYTPKFKTWLSPLGVTGFHGAFIVTHFVAPIVPTLGSLYYYGYWLTPLLNSIGDALESVQRSKWAFEDEWHRWQRLVTEQILPEQKHPAINITSIVGPDGRELSGNVEEVLRMIGAMP
jgi:virulence factor Mce-like protein